MSKETFTPWDSAEVLSDDETIIEYLKAALEESDPELFVKAVGNVARAMGMTAVSQETQLGRPSRYKALSGERDPRIGTVMKVLGALGVRLTVAGAGPQRRVPASAAVTVGSPSTLESQHRRPSY